jgi:hypothetical protein
MPHFNDSTEHLRDAYYGMLNENTLKAELAHEKDTNTLLRKKLNYAEAGYPVPNEIGTVEYADRLKSISLIMMPLGTEHDFEPLGLGDVDFGPQVEHFYDGERENIVRYIYHDGEVSTDLDKHGLMKISFSLNLDGNDVFYQPAALKRIAGYIDLVKKTVTTEDDLNKFWDEYLNDIEFPISIGNFYVMMESLKTELALEFYKREAQQEAADDAEYLARIKNEAEKKVQLAVETAAEKKHKQNEEIRAMKKRRDEIRELLKHTFFLPSKSSLEDEMRVIVKRANEIQAEWKRGAEDVSKEQAERNLKRKRED